MKKTIFITAENTNSGKTFVASGLIQHLVLHNIRVAPFKPVETGVITLPEDGQALLKASQREDITLDEVVPLQFSLPAAPAVANKLTPIEWSKIDTAYEHLLQSSDYIIMEGAGGVLTPLDTTSTTLTLAQRFNAHTVFVSRGELGCISTILLAYHLFTHLQLPWLLYINSASSAFNTISRPYLEHHFSDIMIVDSISELTQRILHG